MAKSPINAGAVHRLPKPRVPLLEAVMSLVNGSFVETFDATVTSDGATVTMSLERQGGGDLTTNFSSGQQLFDCTPAATVALTAGTDAVAVKNCVYILESDRILTVDTAWPSGVEHIPVAYFRVQSAATVQTQGGVYINQNWNDHQADTTTKIGHLAHLGQRFRQGGRGAVWNSGCQATATQDGTDVWVSVAAGVLMQVHEQTFAALDSDTGGAGDMILVVNQNGAPYDPINSLDELDNDSGGNALGVNQYYKAVLFCAGNKGGELSPMYLLLPSGTYPTEAAALADVDGKSNFTIPAEFMTESSTGFLNAAFVLQHRAGQTDIKDTVDLRGTLPASAPNSGVGGGDVSAAAAIPDEEIVVGDGGAKGIKGATGSSLTSGGITIPGTAHLLGVDEVADVSLFFDTDSDTGQLKWVRGSDRFEFADDVLLATTKQLRFLDDTSFINAPVAGDLHLEADDKINLNVANAVEGITIEMGGVEKARFHPTNGALLIGLTAPETDGFLHLAQEDDNCISVIQVASDTANNCILRFKRSRGSVAVPTAVASGDNTLFIQGSQYNGSAYAVRCRWFSQATAADAAKLVVQTGSGSIATSFEVLENQAVLMKTSKSLTFRSGTHFINSPSANRLRIASPTDTQFYVNSGLEMQVNDGNLEFNAGGTNPKLDWSGGSGSLRVHSGGNLMMSFTTSSISAWKPIVIEDSLQFRQEAADPSEPAAGASVMWASDGTGYGAAGDIIMASNVGGTTKKAIVFVYATGAAW